MTGHGRFRSSVQTHYLVLVSLIVLGSCVRANTSVAPGGDPMVIDEDQIALLRVSSAYDIVEQTHSDFFHSRGRESANPLVPAIPVHVFVDDTYYSNDVNSLREIDANVVAEIRFYQSYDAEYKFGSGHIGGVIQVITKN